MEVAHLESRYSRFAFNPDGFVRFHCQVTLPASHAHVLVGAWCGSSPIGLLHIAAGALYWAHARVATVGLVFVLPQVRASLLGGRVVLRMLEFAERWSVRRGLAEIQIPASSGVRLPSLDRTLRRMGFAIVGGTYSWSVPDP